MKHAGPEALGRLEPLLGELRAVPGLTEKRPGVFYRRSRALLHFHEDGSDLYVDVRMDGEWTRHRVVTRSERASLLRAIRSE